MIDQEVVETFDRFIGRDEWLIRKHGLFYRENYCGYTASIEVAGRYSEESAKNHARGCSGEVTMIKAPPPPYLTSLDALRPVLEKLNDEEWIGFQANLLLLRQPQQKHDDNRSAWQWLLTLPPETLARSIALVLASTPAK